MAPALVRAQALQQVRLALAQVHLVEVDILEALGNPAADKADTVGIPAADMGTRQVAPAEVAVRIVEHVAAPLVVVDLQQASDAMCLRSSCI